MDGLFCQRSAWEKYTFCVYRKYGMLCTLTCEMGAKTKKKRLYFCWVYVAVLWSLGTKSITLSRPMGRVINIYTSLTHHGSAVWITETLQAIIIHQPPHTAWNISAAGGEPGKISINTNRCLKPLDKGYGKWWSFVDLMLVILYWPTK